MPKELLFQVTPQVAADPDSLRAAAAKLLSSTAEEIAAVRVLKRSIDARQKAVKINIKASIFMKGEALD